MTPLKQRQNRRPYQRHGLHTLRGALRAVGDQESWLESLGAVGDALKAWKAELIADLGGKEAISTQERALIELATKTYLLLESVDRWLLAQPSLVNKSKRQLFSVVLQRQQLADALARYMSQLGLKRRARPVPSLQEYVAGKYAGDGAGGQEGREGKEAFPETAPPPPPSPPVEGDPEGDQGGGDVTDKASDDAADQENRGVPGGMDL